MSLKRRHCVEQLVDVRLRYDGLANGMNQLAQHTPQAGPCHAA